MNKRHTHSRQRGAMLIIEMDPQFKKLCVQRARALDLTIRQYVTSVLRRELTRAKAA